MRDCGLVQRKRQRRQRTGNAYKTLAGVPAHFVIFANKRVKFQGAPQWNMCCNKGAVVSARGEVAGKGWLQEVPGGRQGTWQRCVAAIWSTCASPFWHTAHTRNCAFRLKFLNAHFRFRFLRRVVGYAEHSPWQHRSLHASDFCSDMYGYCGTLLTFCVFFFFYVGAAVQRNLQMTPEKTILHDI